MLLPVSQNIQPQQVLDLQKPLEPSKDLVFPKDLDKFVGDALSDDEFKKLLKPDKKAEIDNIEIKSLEILTHLYSITDGQERREIEAFIAPPPPLQEKMKEENGKIFKQGFLQRPRPFRRETNFNFENALDQIQANQVIRNIWSTLVHIFIGYNSFNFNGEKPFNKMWIDSKEDQISWLRMKHHYSVHYDRLMMRTFNKADQLLLQKKQYSEEALYQRVAFYALLVFSIIAKITNRTNLMYLGSFCWAFTLGFMFTQYGINTLKLSKIAEELLTSVQIVEKEAAANRIYNILKKV